MPKKTKVVKVKSNEFVAPTNANQMTSFLMNTMVKVANKEIDTKIAATVSRTADTTIRNVKNQVFYNKEMGYKKRKISFLEGK